MIVVDSNWTVPHTHSPLIIGRLRVSGRLTFAFCRAVLSAQRRGVGVGQQRAVRCLHISSAPCLARPTPLRAGGKARLVGHQADACEDLAVEPRDAPPKEWP